MEAAVAGQHREAACEPFDRDNNQSRLIVNSGRRLVGTTV